MVNLFSSVQYMYIREKKLTLLQITLTQGPEEQILTPIFFFFVGGLEDSENY